MNLYIFQPQKPAKTPDNGNMNKYDPIKNKATEAISGSNISRLSDISRSRYKTTNIKVKTNRNKRNVRLMKLDSP
jgi:hypothetical protein